MLPRPRLHPGNTPPLSATPPLVYGPPPWSRKQACGLSPGALRHPAEMSAHGIIVLHFTPGQIRREPERVLAAIKKALASAAGRPALDIRTVPAS